MRVLLYLLMAIAVAGLLHGVYVMVWDEAAAWAVGALLMGLLIYIEREERKRDDNF